MTLPYCTYRTTHPSGLMYIGKGITEKVLNGKYKGSGVRFKLAMTHPGYEWDKWLTVVLDMYATEEEAYAAEEALVPLSSLSNPLLLNMTAGGRKGKYLNHSRLYRKINAEKKAIAKKAKTAKAKQKLDNLKKQLKELK